MRVLGEVGVEYLLTVLSQSIDDTEGQGATISFEEETNEQSSTSKDSGCSVTGVNHRSIMTLIVCMGVVLGVRRRISNKS